MDMMKTASKSFISMIEAKILGIATILQSIIAGKSICVDHVVLTPFFSTDRMQLGLSVCWNDLLIHLAFAFAQSKNDCLAVATPSTLALKPIERLVDFDQSKSRRHLGAGLYAIDAKP